MNQLNKLNARLLEASGLSRETAELVIKELAERSIEIDRLKAEKAQLAAAVAVPSATCSSPWRINSKKREKLATVRTCICMTKFLKSSKGFAPRARKEHNDG